jgi:MinD-like ATPase involved in chromosome partitioning or flagellar assembly
MIVAIASMKGGVGKTTIAGMLARYITNRRGSPVTVIDMDPQRGSTVLLLGPKAGANVQPPTITDVLRSELDGIPSIETFAQAIRKSPYSDKLFVIPANGGLAELMQENAPAELLRWAIEASPLSDDATVIIDTGSAHTLCEMGVAAADLVFIPITLGHQSGVPTINTMKAALVHKTRIGGIIPLMTGEAGWEIEQIEGWRNKLLQSEALQAMGVEVLQSMPSSKLVVRGKWRWGKLPRTILPTLDEIYTKIFGSKDVQERELELCITTPPAEMAYER